MSHFASAARRFFAAGKYIGIGYVQFGAAAGLYVIGRYVLDEEVLERLQGALPTLNGEVQLTDSIAATCRSAGVSAVRYDGRRFDCGNFAGLLQANIAVSQLDEAPAAAPRPAAEPAAAEASAA